MSECSAREARKRVTLRRSLDGARLAPRIGSRRRAMGWTNLWLLLIGGAMLSAACATHRELMVVVVDVSQSIVVVKHEVGGGHLTAFFKVKGDQMVGMIRGHDTLIVLARQR